MARMARKPRRLTVWAEIAGTLHVLKFTAHRFDIHCKAGTAPPYWTHVTMFDKRGRKTEVWGGPTWARRIKR